jgi:3-phosphoshikimate 1-carboxyvinyltransferase
MKVIIKSGRVNGKVSVPYSKSYGHRALIAASLCSGNSLIKGITFSDDINNTINALVGLGVHISKHKNAVSVTGPISFSNPFNNTIDVGESGSTLRFLIPLFSLVEGGVNFTGAKSLFKRDLSYYADLFSKKKIKWDLKENTLSIEKPLNGQIFELPGNISSQFATGLLFFGAATGKKITIKMESPIVSRPYIDITIDVLKSFGVNVIWKSENELYIAEGQKFVSRDIVIEADYSTFSNYAVLGAINGKVSVLNMNLDSKQGDSVILEILKLFGVKMVVVNNIITTLKSPILPSGEISIKNCPDLGPILMVLGLFSKTPLKITNVNRLKDKESNRLKVMVDNLRLFGAKIKEDKDALTIIPTRLKSPKGKVLEPANDHRNLMALVVLATAIRGGAIINDKDCVNKSYPGFFTDLITLGIPLEFVD